MRSIVATLLLASTLAVGCSEEVDESTDTPPVVEAPAVENDTPTDPEAVPAPVVAAQAAAPADPSAAPTPTGAAADPAAVAAPAPGGPAAPAAH